MKNKFFLLKIIGIILLIILLTGGIYTVVVQGVKNSVQDESALTINGESSKQASPVLPGQLKSRQTNHLLRGEKMQHTFQANAGQLIVISLEKPQFHSHLALFGTDGRLLIEAKNFDSGNNSQIEMRLPTTGVYTVELRGIDADAEGEYTLAIAER